MDKLINYLYQNFDIDNKKIINIFEKYKSNNNINDLYEIYNKKPILINPLFKNKITKKEYFDIYIYNKIKIIYDNSNNNEIFKLFINDLIYKKKPIYSTIKRLVWNKYIGENIGKSKCLCCNITDITQLSFHCGHIISERNNGETIVENLKPICQNCNSSMGSKNMDEFIKLLR